MCNWKKGSDNVHQAVAQMQQKIDKATSAGVQSQGKNDNVAAPIPSKFP